MIEDCRCMDGTENGTKNGAEAQTREKLFAKTKYREYWQKTMIPEISCNHLRQLHPRTQRPNGRATMARRTSAHLSIHPHQELHLYLQTVKSTHNKVIGSGSANLHPTISNVAACIKRSGSFISVRQYARSIANPNR